MEDDNGIELTLGLSCGGSAGKSKGKDDTSDLNTEEGGTNKLIDGNLNVADASMKHFLETGIDKPNTNLPQRSDQEVQVQENFWTDLGKCSGTESTNEEKLEQHEFGGKLWLESGNKRKTPFEEIMHPKKHEKEVEHVDTRGKNSMGISLVKTSPVSVTIEDNSSAENDDAAESETEGSTSRLGPQAEDSMKQFMGGGSDASKRKDKHGFPDMGTLDAEGPSLKKVNIVGSNGNLELGNTGYGIPFSLHQPLGVMTVPYPLPVNVPNSGASGSGSGFSLPIMQLMPPTSSERPPVRPMNPNNFPLTFGYPAVQLPTLEIDSSRGIVSQQQVPAYNGRIAGDGVAKVDRVEDELRISQAIVPSPHTSLEPPDMAKNGSKHHPTGTGRLSSSSQIDDEAKGSSTNFRQREITNEQLATEGFPHEGLGIRPGVVPGLKFGGSGSYPDLPWVSTMGPGLNGKTISGVTYRYSRDQIRIVCACHGSHMSPEEFVQHANGDGPNQDNNAASLPNGNPAASAQS